MAFGLGPELWLREPVRRNHHERADHAGGGNRDHQVDHVGCIDI
jgi:hypothetical protein